jgi:hypothetical protein
MLRSLLSAASFALLLLLSSALRAQDILKEQWRTDFSKAVELNDEKLQDKLMKRAPIHAALYYEEMYWEKDAGKEASAAKCRAMAASWKRCFENSDTLEQLDRWCAGTSKSDYQQLAKSRTNSFKVWQHFQDVVSKGLVKTEYEQSLQQMMDLARNAEAIGHSLEVAEIWGLAFVIASKIPDKTLANRRDTVFATEQMLEARKRWNFTMDEHYIRSSEWLKSEKAKIAVDEKAGDKRKTEGYAADAKGIDALAMPNVAEAKHPLKFEPLANLDELDYGAKSGPLPAFWWLASTGKVGTSGKLAWFAARELYLHRTGAAKFAIGFEAGDAKNAVEVDASSKGKVSTIWLDNEKKRPYAMVFWTGSDREMVNEAECNLAPGDNVANVYYHSASSWKAQIGADTVTLYDDSSSGSPGDADPFARSFRSPLLGEYDLDQEKQTLAPLFDSMRIGKGPRVPCSEFVKLGTGWVWLKKGNGDEVSLRPLNPDYVKIGKVKLVWNGPKPTAPVQLVVQGAGDYKTALFDVAGGKEVEMPAGEYHVIWGRMLNGKGTRAQTATLWQGSSKPFTVEAGKTFELKMGGPFTLTFNRRGDESAKIDALKILLAESSGCVYSELHGFDLACDVMASAEADGKGAKPVGKFLRFTDPELVNKAAEKANAIGILTATFPMPEGYKGGEMILSRKLPAAGMKLALWIKKHPLFGEIRSAWQ